MDDDLDFDSILAEIDAEECPIDQKSSEPNIKNSHATNVGNNRPNASLEEELKAMKDKIKALEEQLETKNGVKKRKIMKDVDLFNPASDSEAKQTTSATYKELSQSLFGDNSSDEEAEKYPLESRGLNEYGKVIKAKLPRIEIKSPPKNKSPFLKKEKTTIEKTNNNTEREFFSGIRIKNPIISSSMMKEKMEGRRLIRMSQIQNFLRGGEIEGDWVTIGVIISKTDPKLSAKGKTFSIWKMSDLRDCSKIVSFFLFGNVHKTHWKTLIGSVVGILNPSSMPNKDSGSKYANEISLVIDHQDKVMILGTSKDLSTCLGKRKDGARCTAIVNKETCEFCPFHIQSAYKKISAKRTDLQASYSGPEPSGLKKKILQNQQIFYAGQTYTSSSIKPVQNKKTLNLQSLKLKHEAKQMESNFIEKKAIHLTPDERNVVGGISAQSESFGKMMAVPSSGSRNILKHILNDSPKAENSKIKSVSASELLKMHKQQIEIQNKAQIIGGRVFKPSLSSGHTIPLDNVPQRLSGMTKTDIAKLKAAQIVKFKGSILKENPNAVKPEKSQVFLDKVKEKLKNGNKDESPKQLESKTKKLTTKNEEFERVLNTKSMHADSLHNEEAEIYFDEMETKEKIETQLSKLTEITCKAVSCKKCKYTSFSASDLCKKEGHQLVVHSATKRFFICKNCQRRTVSLNRIPTKACANCGEKNYERTGMKRERSGPKLENEQLSLRGDETKFLNSFDTRGFNINL